MRNAPEAFVKVGNDYGFMIMPKNIISENTSILSFGVGEDIDAEIELARQYGCTMFLYDPTDKSVAYIDKTKASLTARGEKHIADKLVFFPEALWTNDGTVKFYKPQQENFVSHSINNIESSGNYIEVPCLTMKSIMARHNLTKVDYIKMDIEGAEYEVISNMISDRVDFKSIYLELHYNSNYSLFKNIMQIRNTLLSLKNLGYQIIYSHHYRYFCLVK